MSADSSSLPLISLAEASKLTGYNQDYLGQLARSGKLYATKIGRNWATTKKAVEALLSEDTSDYVKDIDESVSSPAQGVQSQNFSGGPKFSFDGLNRQNTKVNDLPVALVEKTPELPKSNLEEVRKRVEHIRLKEELNSLTQSVKPHHTRKKLSLPRFAFAAAMVAIVGIFSWEVQQNFSLIEKLGGSEDYTVVQYNQPQTRTQTVLPAVDFASAENQSAAPSEDQVILQQNQSGQSVLDLNLIDERIQAQLDSEKDQDQGSWVQYVPVYFE